MKTMITETPNRVNLKVKIRALNTNGKSLRLFDKAKDACKFFKISSTKLRAVIEANRILSFENNTYTLERYS